MTGKVLVTGSNGDIGAAIVNELHSQGWEVIATDIDESPSTGWGGTYEQLDVTDASASVRAITKHPDLRAYVGNAGIVVPEAAMSFEDETFHSHINVNLVGNFRLARLIANNMLSHGGGSMLFTGSWVGDRPWPELLSYSSTKAAIAKGAKTLALEWARYDIRVNVIAPGIVNAGLAKAEAERNPEYAERITRTVPLGRLQTPEDVAQGAAFLLSDQARNITGTTLLIDGGASLGMP
jgi:NAD(P)-dependent dehydrogenase (short-subunit alcohol dehydrogenase family)